MAVEEDGKDIHSDSIAESMEFIEALYGKSKAFILYSLSISSTFQSGGISRNLFFPEKKKQIFYLSLLLIQSYDRQVESKLMASLHREYINSSADKTFLRHCLWKFSKLSLRAFIQSNICDIKAIKTFVGFLAPKLMPNVIEIWFEDDFEFIDELYSRMNKLEISKGVIFNDRSFSHLLKYKAFRKAVFNGNVDRAFVIGMKNYANRGDFNYLYEQLEIPRTLDPSCLKFPRDSEEFSFFKNFDPECNGDILKIRRYQLVIGHNFILNLFVNNNITGLCSATEASDVALEIVNEAILYNSNIMRDIESGQKREEVYEKIKSANDVAFDLLKKNEKILKTCISNFHNPKDRVLQNLLLGRFNLIISEASEYINLGYEDSLIDYFRTKSVADLIGVIDEWNSEFFLKLFSEMKFDVDSAITVLDFIQKSSLWSKKAKIAEIYDQIMKINDRRVFDKIDPTLKHIYVMRNEEYRLNFVSDLLINPHSVIASAHAYEIFKLDPTIKLQVLEIFKNQSVPINKEISLVENIPFCTNDIIDSQFICSMVLKDDAFCIFAYHFDHLIEKIMKVLSKEDVVSLNEAKHDFRRYILTSEYGADRIRLYLDDEVNFGTIEKISFIMHCNLSNKYVSYAVFNSLLEFLTNGNSIEKIFVLTYIKPSILTKYHIIRFINALIPLLNSSNITVCKLSKIKFNEIRVETREVQNILPYIVQAFLDRDNFKEFVNTFRMVQFNNYLCFNSLNLLLQLFLCNLDQYPSECFDILKRLVNVIKDKDIQYISGLLFKRISLFVINNGYSTADALEVASQFCLHTTSSDFEVLLGGLNSLRIANFLVEVLKAKGDSALNDAIICHVLSRSEVHNGVPAVEPPFVAAACELSEFSRHLSVFIPLLKKLFMSEKIETRQVACKALKSITHRSALEEYKEMIDEYLVDCCMHPDYFIRLQSLDITTNLPIIFILRHDQHSLVKKKASDVWKQLVQHTNKELKCIFPQILNFIKYAKNRTLLPALKEVATEFAVKYTGYLDTYMSLDVPNSIKEFIYIEAVKNNRLCSQASEFCKSNFCPSLFNILSKNPKLRDDIVDSIDKSLLYDLCAEDSDLAFYLFNKTKSPIYIEFILTTQKLEAIKRHSEEHKKVDISDENMIFILQSVESSVAIEDLLIKIHPSFSYYYISVYRTNYGRLPFIFERVFSVCTEVDELVSSWNVEYIRGCSFERIKDRIGLLLLVLAKSERVYFDRAIELIREIDCNGLEDEVLFEILGYLFRNLLLVNRRLQCAECIKIIYDTTGSKMGYFKVLAEKTAI